MTGQANPRLRHGDLNQRWVRACPNPILTEAHFGAVAFGVLLVLSVLFAAEAGLFAIAFGCSAAVLVWLSLRAARMGVYINRDGVLVRRFWGRKVGVAWEAIERFEVTRRNRNGAEVDQYDSLRTEQDSGFLSSSATSRRNVGYSRTARALHALSIRSCRSAPAAPVTPDGPTRPRPV